MSVNNNCSMYCPTQKDVYLSVAARWWWSPDRPWCLSVSAAWRVQKPSWTEHWLGLGQLHAPPTAEPQPPLKTHTTLFCLPFRSNQTNSVLGYDSICFGAVMNELIVNVRSTFPLSVAAISGPHPVVFWEKLTSEPHSSNRRTVASCACWDATIRAVMSMNSLPPPPGQPSLPPKAAGLCEEKPTEWFPKQGWRQDLGWIFKGRIQYIDEFSLWPKNPAQTCSYCCCCHWKPHPQPEPDDHSHQHRLHSLRGVWPRECGLHVLP